MAKLAKKEERGFTYQKRDKETLKERANMRGGNFDVIFKPKFKQWKPKDGKNLIRILPPTWDDARHYGLDIFVNYSIGPDNQSYLSLSKHGLGADPLAEAKREAQQEGDKDLAKDLNPSQRILYWIVDRNDEEEGPLLWAAPFTFDKSLSNLCIDEDTKEVIFIDDPAKGRDVRFYKEGTGLTTKYDPSKMKVLGESNLAEDEGLENDWLDFITENPLPEVLNFYDYDHIKATFDGQAGRKSDEADEKPLRRAAKSEDDGVQPRAARTRVGGAADDEDDNPPVRPGRVVASDSADAPRLRTRAPVVDVDEDEKPVRRTRGRVESEEDDEVGAPLERSRRGKIEEPDEDGGSLRERLARRRSRSTSEDDDD